MAGIGTRKSGDAQKALLRKGFRSEERGHHTYYILYVEGKASEIYTYFSRQNTGADLQRNEVGGMKRQLKFGSPEELFRFIDCSTTEAQYVATLRDQGILPALPPAIAPDVPL